MAEHEVIRLFILRTYQKISLIPGVKAEVLAFDLKITDKKKSQIENNIEKKKESLGIIGIVIVSYLSAFFLSELIIFSQ